MLREIKAYDCECEKCKHVWFSPTVPSRCAKCKSRLWNAGEVVEPKRAVVVESRRPIAEPKAEIMIKDVCAWCGSKLVAWGSGRRCESCKRNQ